MECVNQRVLGTKLGHSGATERIQILVIKYVAYFFFFFDVLDLEKEALPDYDFSLCGIYQCDYKMGHLEQYGHVFAIK